MKNYFSGIAISLAVFVASIIGIIVSVFFGPINYIGYCCFMDKNLIKIKRPESS